MLTIENFPAGEIGNNTYFVYGAEESAAVIDPSGGAVYDENGRITGARGRSEEIRARAAELGKRVTAVLLTHGHWDHMADAEDFKRHGAKNFIAREDASMLRGVGTTPNFARMRVTPTEADVLLSDGDTVKVGDLTFEVIATPGHSRGSVTYKIENALFTGDTLFHGDFGRFDLAGGDFGALRKSLARLFALTGNYDVYPGHEEETTLAEERAHNAIRRFPEGGF